MFKIISSVILTVFCLLLINCSGKYCLQPEIKTNKININKRKIEDIKNISTNKSKQFLDTNDLSGIKGFFKKRHMNISLKIETDTEKGIKNVNCYGAKNNLLWVYSNNDRPYKMTSSLSVYESDNESMVILTEYILQTKIQSVIILNEYGNVVHQFNLPESNRILWNMTGQTILDKSYLVAVGGNGIGIYEFNSGKLVIYLYSGQVAPLNLQKIDLINNGNKYICFLMDLRNYAKSSKIFILSDKWDLLYEEVIPSGWVFGKVEGSKNSFIVKTFEILDCKETGKDIIWKYTIE